MIPVDTGPLVAAANRTDAHHEASIAALVTAKPPRLVLGLVIAEVSCLLARDAGSTIEAEFLRSFATGFLTVTDLTSADLDRAPNWWSSIRTCLLALPMRVSSPWPNVSGSLSWQLWITVISTSSDPATWTRSPLSHSYLSASVTRIGDQLPTGVGSRSRGEDSARLRPAAS